MIEKVKNNLRRVKCYHSATNLEIGLQKATKEDLSCLDFLVWLLDRECECRDKNRINQMLRKANLPSKKSFDEFEHQV